MYALLTSFYMTAKAHLAQALMTYAWDKRQIEKFSIPKPPWPWADFHPIAKLSFMRFNLSQLVLNSDSGQALAFGPGLTAANTVSQHGDIIISGHNDSHFAILEKLKIGDELQLETLNAEVLHYRIENLQIIDTRKNQLQVYKNADDEQSLILVTCYPFNGLVSQTPYRLIVQALPMTYFKET
ncbi:MAG: class GN sortase [Colwellia sp.]|nr:class GN sortase [Colwellia sp.]